MTPEPSPWSVRTLTTAGPTVCATAATGPGAVTLAAACCAAARDGTRAKPAAATTATASAPRAAPTRVERVSSSRDRENIAVRAPRVQGSSKDPFLKCGYVSKDAATTGRAELVGHRGDLL